MAESWIKMRGSLMTSPKVIRMARVLLADPEFLAWYAPQGLDDGVGVTGCVTVRHVTRHESSRDGDRDASRTTSHSVTRRHVAVVTRVTVGTLVQFWAAVNECAGNDGAIRDASHFEVDEMAGVPGFARALEAVGWLRAWPDEEGVELPNFIEHNTLGRGRSTRAKTDAARAKEYRDRRNGKTGEGVTPRHESSRDASRDGAAEKRDASRDTVTTEKRRVDKKENPPNPPAGGAAWPDGFADFIKHFHAARQTRLDDAAAEFRRVVEEGGMTPQSLGLAAARWALAQAPLWEGDRGQSCPTPLRWLRDRRWRDADHAAAAPAVWPETRSGVEALAARQGMPAWDQAAFERGQGEPFASYEGRVRAAVEGIPC